MAGRISEAINRACQLFLFPIAQFLLSKGFKYPEFCEAAKVAFVQAAMQNESSVKSLAEITGIQKRDVSAIKEEPVVNIREIAKELAVHGELLTHWRQDEEFTNSEGLPIELPRSGAISFNALVDRVSTALDADIIFDELQNVGTIEKKSDGLIGLKMHYYIPGPDDLRWILRYGMRLRDIASTLNKNKDSAGLFEAAAYNLDVRKETVRVLHELTRQRGISLLHACDDWLTEQSNANAAETVRVGVGIYFFEE